MAGDRRRADPARPAGPALAAGSRRRPVAADLAAEGVPPSPRRAGSSSSRGPTLRPLDPATGQPRWSADLGGAAGLGRLPRRQAHRRDRRAGSSRSSLDDGADAVAVSTRRRRARPPRRRPVRPAGDRGRRPTAEPPGTLHDFRIVGGRVFCLRGDRELIALDGDTGLVDWSFTPPAGRDQPEPLDRPAADRAPGPQAERAPGARDRRPAAGRAEYPAGRGRGVARAAPAADRRRPRRCWCPTAGRSPSSTSTAGSARLGLPREPGAAQATARPGCSATPSGCWSLHDGNELIRLDPATGVEAVVAPAGHRGPERAARGASPRRRAVLLGRAGQTLDAALSLADGSLALDAPPDRARRSRLVDRADRALRRWPTPALAPPVGRRDRRACPLVFRRRDTGELVQRLLFPVADRRRRPSGSRPGALRRHPRGLWALGERSRSDESGPGTFV